MAWFWLIAGPNGAGKSTHARGMANISVIDPDNPTPGHPVDPFAAGRITLEWVRTRTGQGQSFGVETTLAGTGYLKTAAALKANGWNIGLVYVGLRSAALAEARVRARHASGGHAVPPLDIARRYERSLATLRRAIEVAHLALVYDNSNPDDPMRLVLQTLNASIEFRADPLPPWLAPHLPR